MTINYDHWRGTPKTDPDYAESEAALRVSIVDRLRKGPAPHVIEKDPYGGSVKEPGVKLDDGKSPVFQGLFDYFPRACLAVANVSHGGANKYTWKGWDKVPDGINRYRNALGRHILKEAIEGPYDVDGFRHAAQVAWNAMASLELILREEEKNASK